MKNSFVSITNSDRNIARLLITAIGIYTVQQGMQALNSSLEGDHDAEDRKLHLALDEAADEVARIIAAVRNNAEPGLIVALLGRLMHMAEGESPDIHTHLIDFTKLVDKSDLDHLITLKDDLSSIKAFLRTRPQLMARFNEIKISPDDIAVGLQRALQQIDKG